VATRPGRSRTEIDLPRGWDTADLQNSARLGELTKSYRVEVPNKAPLALRERAKAKPKKR
jgi:hypothetical protein